MNETFPAQTLSRMDWLGVCLSLACAAQCLAMPMLVTVLPLAGIGFFLFCQHCGRCRDEGMHGAT